MEKQTRISYSKEFKRFILRALARGEKLEELFLNFSPDVKKCLKNDKKYILKLTNKWRHEYYSKREDLFFANQILSNEVIESELQAFEPNKINVIEKRYKIKKEENLKKNLNLNDV